MTTAAPQRSGAGQPASGPVSQTISVHNRAHRPFPAQGLTYGVPWPRGAVKSVDELALTEDGKPLPAAFTELNRWPDGSLQWTLIDASLDLAPSATRALTVERVETDKKRSGGSGPAADRKPGLKNPVAASVEGSAARIGNGLVELVFSAKVG